MTRYDNNHNHPLCGVPQDVLDCARAALSIAADDKVLDHDEVESVADMIVSYLHEDGYITWENRNK